MAANAANQITKISDEYLDFIAVEPTLFTLNIKNSYVGCNSPALTEVDICCLVILCSSVIIYSVCYIIMCI